MLKVTAEWEFCFLVPRCLCYRKFQHPLLWGHLLLTVLCRRQLSQHALKQLCLVLLVRYLLWCFPWYFPGHLPWNPRWLLDILITRWLSLPPPEKSGSRSHMSYHSSKSGHVSLFEVCMSFSSLCLLVLAVLQIPSKVWFILNVTCLNQCAVSPSGFDLDCDNHH